jgi:hypothetical protein
VRTPGTEYCASSSRPDRAVGKRGTHRDIVGMTEEERAPLLQFLFAHQVKPEFTCR